MDFEVGKSVYKIPEENGFHLSIIELIKTEENRVLKLLQCGIQTEEYILIHFVRMYILRWALPVVEIENNGQLNASLIPEIQKRYWLCMYGRALDDIHDRDSRFFTLADSCILLTTYSGLLKLDIDTEFGKHILKSGKASLEFLSKKHEKADLTFNDIMQDVCVRVAYFQSSPDIKKDLATIVDQYIGVFLGKADLDDCIPDGAEGVNSTLMSRHLYKNVADDEQKIHYNRNLAEWYQNTFYLIVRNAELLLIDLQKIDAKYCINFLESELKKWNSEHEQINLK
jgi:hypothetical protein